MAKTIAKESDFNKVVDLINKKIHTLEDNDVEFIKNILDFHNCEPIAAAEKISEYLKVDYNSIFDLL